MSDELFEIAFSGKISEGASLETVKARVGKMFNADGAQLERLFSGQPIVIKKNVDQSTAYKYKYALQSAGAECEIKSMSATTAGARASSAPATESAPTPPASVAPSTANASTADVAPPPQLDPLGITADQIGDLQATLAPVGSELQSEVKAIPEPQYDLSAFDLAPVGSDLGSAKKEPGPPPPDTSGLSLVDS